MKTFVLIGHVDNGKSSLAGHLLYKCGHITDHDMKQLEREAIENKMEPWKYAYVLDTDQNERLRGKTHEFTTVEFKHNNQEYMLIDTPGHKSFIRSMIGGVSLIKNIIGVLVVSVLENEFGRGFSGGQIKEDLIIAKACGINNLIVAMNKIDGIDYDEEKYNIIKDKLSKFIKNLGFSKVTYIPVSAWTGENLTTLSPKIPFYTGSTFIELIDQYANTTEIIKKTEATMMPKNRISVTMRFLGNLLESSIKLIAPGFDGIMYYNSKEYPIVFEKLFGIDKKPTTYVVNNDFSKKYIVVISSIEPIELDSNFDKFILRNGDDFIGFGNIIMPKN